MGAHKEKLLLVIFRESEPVGPRCSTAARRVVPSRERRVLGYGRRKSTRTIIRAGAHSPAEGISDRWGVVERKTGATATYYGPGGLPPSIAKNSAFPARHDA